jgi:hypothetical protein
VPPFLTSALDDDWSASRHGQFTPVLILHKVVLSHNQSQHCGEENIFPVGNRTPIVQPVVRCYTNRAIPTSVVSSNN